MTFCPDTIGTIGTLFRHALSAAIVAALIIPLIFEHV